MVTSPAISTTSQPTTPADRIISQEPLEVTPQQECEKKGGKWDAATRTCIMNVRDQVAVNQEKKAAAEAAKVEEPPKVDALETFTSSETGRASGITTPDGSTFLGLSPEDVQAVATGEQARTARPEGTAPVGTAQAEAIRQQQIQQQIAQIGQLGQINPAQQADINLSQAFTAGAAGIVPAAAGGAAIGAAAGLVGSGGVLSAPGALAVGVAGAVGGFVSGVLSNIKEQQRGELQAADI